MNWLKKKKKKSSFLKCCLLLFYTKTTDHFSFGMWPTVKSGVYTTGNDQLSVWTTKLLSTSESQTCTKKRSWSLFSDLLPIWSTIVFWIPVKPLYLISYVQQIDEMHRKLQCMQPAGQHKGPNSSPWHLTARGTTNASKVEWIRVQQVLSQLPYSPKLLPTNYHFKNLHNFL